MVAILVVQCGTYFLNARTATHWLVVDHSPLLSAQVDGTNRLCILNASWNTLPTQAQQRLLSTLSNSFETIYVGFDTVPEDLRVYVRWAAENPVVRSKSTIFTREIVHKDLNLFPRSITDGTWFYWYPVKKGLFRQRLWYCTDRYSVSQNYFWIFGCWVRTGRPFRIHGDGGYEILKTLAEWKSEIKENAEPNQKVDPIN